MEPLRIMVVDDNELFAHALCRALEILRERAWAVVHPADALTFADFDAVITDLEMPVMNGVELARALRERDPELPLVFSSGLAESSPLVAEARALGEWLPKPWRMSDLEALLGRLRAAKARRG
jgi:CheY-like chemotaxis protein